MPQFTRSVQVITGGVLAIAAALCLTACGSPQSSDIRKLGIDQVPMYGNMDRQLVPVLAKADAAFIESASSAFGGRERAARHWVEQGFAYYFRDDLENAMRRFNQAWLLDPKNPESYWGFASVLHDRGMAFGAHDMNMRAYALGWRDPGFLADFGRVAALRCVEDPKLTVEERAAFLAESDAYYKEAIQNDTAGKKAGYIYASWATARFWVEDYAGAWANVILARQHDGIVPTEFLEMLRAKMPEPR